MRFKQEFSFEQRREEAYRVINKFPDRVPIICEKSRTASINCPNIDKKKYLVLKNLTMADFQYYIRKRLRLAPEKAIFLIVNNSFAPSFSFINEIYSFHRDLDGFLYITYDIENVFG